MSLVRRALAGFSPIVSGKLTINSTSLTFFDFGTPNDINLASAAVMAGYRPGDRVLVICTASTVGTTDSITWSIRDAPDSNGSVGSLVAASLNTVFGSLSAGTSDDYSAFTVNIQPGRPWLAVGLTSTGTTDTFVCHCTVWSVPNGA